MIRHENIVVSKRLVAINSASSVLARLVNVTVLLWMYQYLLQRVAPDEFAVYPVVTAVMVVAPLFFSFFTGGVSRYVLEAYAKGAFEQVTRIVSSIFPLLAGATAVFLAAGTLFALNVEKVLNVAPAMVDDARAMMLLLVASFSLQMLALPFGTGYHVRQRFVELNLLGIGRDLLRIALLFVLLLGIGPQVLWVVLATVIAEAVHVAVMVVRSRRMVPELRFRRRLFERRQSRELLSFGLWTTLGRLGTIMFTNAATIVLNLYGSAVDVTSYHIGATFFRQIEGAIGIASQPLQPVLTAMHALQDNRRLGATVLRGGRYALWVALAVATPLAIYADEFIHLYVGETYASAAAVIVLFMVTFPFTQPNALLPMTAMATARVREFFLPAFLFQAAGLFLMLVLTARGGMGAVGAALSLTAVMVASQLLYYWRLCLRLTGLPFAAFAGQALAPGLAPALAAAVVWTALKLVDPPDTWPLLVLYGAAGEAVYLGVALGLQYQAMLRRWLGLGARLARPAQ